MAEESVVTETWKQVLLKPLRWYYGKDVFITRLSFAFLVVVVLYAFVLVITQTAAIIITALLYHSIPDVKDLYFFAILIIFYSLYMVYFAVDAVIQENRVQLVMFFITSWVVAVRVCYGFINEILRGRIYRFADAGISTVVCIIGQIFICSLFYFIWKSFGKVVLAVIGVDVKLIQLYRIYEIFIGALKLDLQFLTAALFGIFLYIRWFQYYEYIIVSICFVFNWIFCPIVIYFGARREWLWVMIIFVLYYLLFPAYFIWINTRAWLRGEDVFDSQNPELTILSLSVVIYIFVVWRLITNAIGVVVMCGFGRGLGRAFAESDGRIPKGNDEKKPRKQQVQDTGDKNAAQEDSSEDEKDFD